ncbi:hypothetical protein QTI66_34450 [Variovorax sp. J22R133]|uniref:hypothetical protein n=1 Tax=Variovorax brevis TaxID=3053503 RepID=UPI0025759EE8|nr:hypothetical protein [Variovorax sp. J22R133]MDM0117223.1 hypothetical protein [Variovorax sp. J22R133]
MTEPATVPSLAAVSSSGAPPLPAVQQVQQVPPVMQAAPVASMAPRVGALEPAEFYGLLHVVVADATLKPGEKRMLVSALRKSTPVSDRWTFRWAIWILGFVVLLTVGALWSLSMSGTGNIPDGLVAIGSAAAGGLAGLLAPGRGNDQP